MMEKYTFIAEYDEGTYISQYKANNLENAISCWIENLDRNYFSESVCNNILKKRERKLFYPTLLQDIENVWCITNSIDDKFLLINIIKTV